MANVLDSPVVIAVLVVIVSAVYAYWLWSRFRIGRYDALWSSGIIICLQLIYAFRAENPPLALIATAYHAALVAAVFTASKGLAKPKTTIQ